MHRTILSTLAVAFALSLSSAARATLITDPADIPIVVGDLRIDFSLNTETPLQTDFLGFASPDGSTPISQIFSSGHGVGGAVQVSVSGQTLWRDYSAISSGPFVTYSNLFSDHVLRNANGTMTLALSNLSDGKYEIMTFHHTTQSGAGSFSPFLLTDSLVTDQAVTSSFTVSAGLTPTGIESQTFQFNVVGSDNVTIKLPATGGSNISALNGFIVHLESETLDWNAANLNWASAGNWAPTTTPDDTTLVNIGNGQIANVTTSDAETLSLTVQNSSTLNVASTGHLTVGANVWFTNDGNVSLASGGQLTAAGLRFGDGAINDDTQVSISGGGTLSVARPGGSVIFGNVGNLGTSANINQGTVDMSGLATLNIDLGTTGLLRMGDAPGATDAGDGSWLFKTAADTTITAGTLDIGGTTQHTGTQTIKLGSGEQVMNANTISLGGTSLANSRASGEISFEGVGGTLKIRSAADPISGSANLNIANAAANGVAADIVGTFDVTGHNVDLRLGTLAVGIRQASTTGATQGAFSFDTGTLVINTLQMGHRSNVNSAAGVTSTVNLDGGTVTIGSISELGLNVNTAGAGSTIATLNVTAGNVSIGPISQFGGNGSANGVVDASINFLGGNITFTGNITRSVTANSNANSTLILDGATLDMGGFNIGSSALIKSLQFKTGTLLNVGQINGGAGLAKSTPGTLILDGTNTYTGITVVSDGLLRLNSANALPGGIGPTGGTSNLNLSGGVVGLGAGNLTRPFGNGGAQVQWTAGGGGFAAFGADRFVNIGSSALAEWNVFRFVPSGSPLILGHATATHTLDFQNPINLNGAVREVRVHDGSAAVDAILSGILSGTGASGLDKTGAGTLLLTANNSYLGATNVNAGTLLVNGSTHASSTVTVAPGATLGGDGTIGGNTVIRGTHSPGNSPDTQTFLGNLTYEDGGDPDPLVLWELIANTTASPGTNFDTIVVGGALTFDDLTTLELDFNNASSVLWSDPFWGMSHTGTGGWLLYDVTGAITGFPTNLTINAVNWLDSGAFAFNTARPGSSFSLSQQGNDIYLEYNFVASAIPEPSTYALALLGLAGLGLAVWRRGADSRERGEG